MKRLITAGALILIMASCSNSTMVNETGKGKEQAITVKTAKALTRDYIPFTELSGTAYADREANLGAALPGRVEKIYFPAGSRVKKGDLLVSLSAELYTQALAEFTTVEKDYERVSRLVEKESITKQDYDHVKALYESSEARLAMMRKNAEIRAPFSGIITEYLVQEGENYFFNFNLDPGYSSTSGILRLMNTDPIQVEVAVNEKEIGQLRQGQKALVSFDATGDSVFAGSISLIKPVLSALTHTAQVKIRVANPKGLIKPGMFAHVRIQLNLMSSVCVPADAVYRQPGTAEDYLFIAEGNRVKRTAVKRLWTDGSWIAVTEAGADATVVTAGKEKLHDGSLIIIK